MVNAIENKYCFKCSYPLVPQAFEEIKSEEDKKLKMIEEKHSKEIQSIRKEMNEQFAKLCLMIQQNPKLVNVKPEILTKI
ncbi:MAG: hypothetical protein ACPKPY_09345 [Nitrososphaeraceae archaeon]